MGTANAMCQCQQLGQAVDLGQLLGCEAKASGSTHTESLCVCVCIPVADFNLISWKGGTRLGQLCSSLFQRAQGICAGVCVCEQPCELLSVCVPTCGVPVLSPAAG